MKKIKYYRLQNKLTQEKLGAELCISFQAISKWERNECLPDVTVIGRLAEVLRVSCDTLLLDNGCFAEGEINDILEKGLAKYPRSFALMAALAESYSMGTGYPEFEEKNYLKRTIDLEEYIAANCTDTKLRYGAVQMLCGLYRSMERYECIRALAETMPEICQTRQALIYHSMPGKEQNQGIHDYLMNLLDSAESVMSLLIWPHFDEEEQTHFDHLRELADTVELWNTERYE